MTKSEKEQIMFMAYERCGGAPSTPIAEVVKVMSKYYKHGDIVQDLVDKFWDDNERNSTINCFAYEF